MSELDKAVARGKEEISDDIAAGIVPAGVASFAELHDYVDANEYGGLCDPEAYGDSERYGVEFAAAVQDALDAWVKAGRP
jgi:hypothetical protein